MYNPGGETKQGLSLASNRNMSHVVVCSRWCPNERDWYKLLLKVLSSSWAQQHRVGAASRSPPQRWGQDQARGLHEMGWAMAGRQVMRQGVGEAPSGVSSCLNAWGLSGGCWEALLWANKEPSSTQYLCAAWHPLVLSYKVLCVFQVRYTCFSERQTDELSL